MRKISINYGTPTIIITAILCILKLVGVLNISWLWCFCLIWLPFVIMAGIFIMIIPAAVIVILIKTLLDLK